ncbi:MAG: phosphatidylglycerol lysyltransferase domain-containing protein, partial [Acidimicrobiales bacterium]
QLIPDRIEVALPKGTTVVICSDLHLADRPTDASRLVTDELCERLLRLTGRGAVVLNGDCFELLLALQPSVDAALDAHPAFAEALAGFGLAEGRALIVTVGSHDGRLAWDEHETDVLRTRLGATVALSADLLLDTDRGVRVVRVEHGHQFDPAHALRDARDPLDTPLGQHMVQEVVPELTGRTFLADALWLADPDQLPRFVGSRVVYRELLGRAGWLIVPLVLLLLAIRTPIVVAAMSVTERTQELEAALLVGLAGLVVDLSAIAVLIVVIARRVFRSLTTVRLGARGAHVNEPPRTAAEALCAQDFAGFVTGHTHHPELMPLRQGFYANTGCGVHAVEPHRARAGMPPVFGGVLRRSWLELVSGRDVEVSLVLAETPVAGATLLERMATRRLAELPSTPTVVSSSPGGAGWPIDRTVLSAAPRRRRSRRVAAGAALLAAVVGLYSAVTAPSRGRLKLLLDVVPVELVQAASATLVFASIALVLLARGLRRGHRLAWFATLAVLAVAAVLHLLKGGDVEEALFSAAIGAWLAAHSDAFQVRPDTASLRRAARLSLAGAAVAVGVSEVLVIALGTHRPAHATIRALVERLAGNSTIPLPGDTPFVTPALAAVGVGLAFAVLLVLFGPRRPPPPSRGQHLADRTRARRVVEQYGGDTLGYFALRDDKEWFFTGASVVAYGVRNGVCLVSPDPIGPVDEWADTWSEFAAFADQHGWPVAVVGAGPGWLPVYEAAGMQSIYMGDEAIVDCQAFTLDGGSMKGLRGSYNRIKKAGYTTVFLPPDQVGPEMEQSLRDMMADTRQGATERGFSMTLSRVFDPDDTDLLLSIALDPDGRPTAFCQWVPAADIAGWSLDLTRRSAAQQPNGVSDFLIVEMILHLKANHQVGLGLNFAVMREIVAGERGGGFSSLERRILHKFSETMQIESLWRYNLKFRPYWRPRYVVLDAVEHSAAQTVAIAGAESIWELPLLGRFIK